MIPEPKTFNGAPGEVYGDDSLDTRHRPGPRVQFVCACGKPFANAICAREHHDATKHSINYLSGKPTDFRRTA